MYRHGVSHYISAHIPSMIITRTGATRIPIVSRWNQPTVNYYTVSEEDIYSYHELLNFNDGLRFSKVGFGV